MEVNQNINAANFMLVSAKAGDSLFVKKSDSETVDFASVLQDKNNQYSYPDNTKDSIVQKATDRTSSKDVVREQSALSKDNAVESTENTPEETPKAENTKDSNLTNSVTDKKEIEDSSKVAEETEEISEEEMKDVLEAIGNLLQSVMEQFGFSLEELDSKLEEFGMEVSDLMTQDGLKAFFLNMKGAEVSDLIVDENLNMELQAFLGDMSDELESLQNVLPDVEIFGMQQDVKQFVEAAVDFVLQDTAGEDMPEDRAFLQTDAMADAEPEVVVVDNRTQEKDGTKQNSSEQTADGQQTDLKQQTSSTETVAELTTEKQPSFENPILQGIKNAVNQVEGTMLTEEPVQQTDIVRQLVEQIRLNMNAQTTSLELQLYPEHLGRIQIQVVAKEGVMTASIVAETEAAKQAIESGLLNLKDAMNQQDLKVEAIEVMVSTMGFEKGEEQQDSMHDNHTSNARRKLDLSDLNEELPIEDAAEVEKMKASGSSVSYTA